MRWRDTTNFNDVNAVTSNQFDSTLPPSVVRHTTDPTSSRSIAISVVYLTIGSLGLAGNLLVVVVVVSWANMRRKVTNIFIINQSCIDLVVSVVLIMSRITLWIDVPLRSDSLADQVYCRLWTSRAILFSLMMSSTYGVLALTIER